ncbi:Uncharacterised protein [Vibrio cholerae]|nr:Uncharacterised protein [Vibrio cholerae]CSI83132.1 Uncharacterised protein [Vibrio cholerae]
MDRLHHHVDRHVRGGDALVRVSASTHIYLRYPV